MSFRWLHDVITHLHICTSKIRPKAAVSRPSPSAVSLRRICVHPSLEVISTAGTSAMPRGLLHVVPSGNLQKDVKY